MMGDSVPGSTSGGNYNADPRIAVFVCLVVNMDAQYNLRILGARPYPLALNNLPLFDRRERSLHLFDDLIQDVNVIAVRVSRTAVGFSKANARSAFRSG